MKAVLKKPFQAVKDWTVRPWKAVILSGKKYQVERISNPTGLGCDWLVLKGTRTGTSEFFWRENAKIYG